MYMEFRKMVMMIPYARQQKRHRCKEQILDSVGEDKGGMIWENSIEACILSYLKEITSPGLIHKTKHQGVQGWCTGMTMKDGMEEGSWVGG